MCVYILLCLLEAVRSRRTQVWCQELQTSNNRINLTLGHQSCFLVLTSKCRVPSEELRSKYRTRLSSQVSQKRHCGHQTTEVLQLQYK